MDKDGPHDTEEAAWDSSITVKLAQFQQESFRLKIFFK